MSKPEYRCPECGATRVRVEVSAMLVIDGKTGEWHIDPMTHDVSDDGYAECLSCSYDTIAEDFKRAASLTVCQSTGQHHSDDLIEVYSGSTTPTYWCGYHESQRG